MRRRDFITAFAAVAPSILSPLAARAQQGGRVRRIGVVMGVADDAEGRARMSVFVRRLAELGWSEGGNVQLDLRWGAGDTDRAAAMATDLVAAKPDVIVINSVFALLAAKQSTRSIPIVFVQAFDPVKEGIVADLAHPGGNITGFTQFVSTMEEKWLDLIKQIAPGVTRIAFLHAQGNPTVPARVAVAQAAAAKLGMQVLPMPIQAV